MRFEHLPQMLAADIVSVRPPETDDGGRRPLGLPVHEAQFLGGGLCDPVEGLSRLFHPKGVLFVDGGIPGLPVHHRRARVDQVPHFPGGHLLQQIDVASQVLLQNFQGIFGKRPGEVEDGVHPIHRRLQGVPVLQARPEKRKPLVPDGPEGLHVLVDDPYLVPPPQERSGQIPSRTTLRRR